MDTPTPAPQRQVAPADAYRVQLVGLRSSAGTPGAEIKLLDMDLWSMVQHLCFFGLIRSADAKLILQTPSGPVEIEPRPQICECENAEDGA